jgi:hypothetical protein
MTTNRYQEPASSASDLCDETQPQSIRANTTKKQNLQQIIMNQKGQACHTFIVVEHGHWRSSNEFSALLFF